MKLRDLVTEMAVRDVEKMDAQDVQWIKDGKHYIYIKTMSKELMMGPFDSDGEARDYMNRNTSNIVRDKIVVDASEARKIATGKRK